MNLSLDRHWAYPSYPPYPPCWSRAAMGGSMVIAQTVTGLTAMQASSSYTTSVTSAALTCSTEVDRCNR